MTPQLFDVPARRISFWLVGLVALLAALGSALLVGGARSASEASGLIAFTRLDGVYVMRADGSGVRRISPVGFRAHGVAWSPDGARLAFVGGAEEGIWVMKADGSGLVRLTRTTATSAPTWSPEGRRIAFAAYADGHRDIWIMNADGSNLHRLTIARHAYLDVLGVDWSPVGDQLAFTRAGWLADIYVMKTDGSSVRNLTPERGWVASSGPDWSPDGRQIVFTHAAPFGQKLPLRLAPRNAEIWVMSATGTSRTRLTNNRLSDDSAAWSPDGNRIAFVRALNAKQPNSGGIYVMNADGTGVTRLTHNHVGEASPAWQPVATP